MKGLAPQVVGSLIFCPQCGNLFDLPGEEEIAKCQLCDYSFSWSEIENTEIKYQSRPNTFEKYRQQDTEVLKRLHFTDYQNQTDTWTELSNRATINESCKNPKCDSTEMYFHTMQLRSADEGQTVFYTCTKCGEQSRQNN